jgi:hypothetical protein
MRGSDSSAGQADDRVREIPKWAGRYAQNRTLPVVVMIVINAAACCVFLGLGLLTGWAYIKGIRGLAAASMLVLCGFLAWWLWFCFIGVFRITRSIFERLYRGEGSVFVGACTRIEESKRPLLVAEQSKGPLLAAFVLMFCVHASVGLGFLELYPIRLIQPVSALYVVPFLCYLGVTVRRAGIGSPFLFIWPTLYGIHAVLIVAGAPVRLGPWLDMAVPTVGYGLLAALSGHIYSRLALRRLRSLAGTPESHQGAVE